MIQIYERRKDRTIIVNRIALRTILSTITLLATGAAGAQEATGEHYRVVTREVPPFAMTEDGAHWEGISIALWQAISAELNFTYDLYDADLETMLAHTESGEADAAVGALTITSEREKLLDFSHPFYSTGLGIATHTRGNWALGLIRALFSWSFLTAIASLFFVLIAAGGLLWFFEHKRNPEQFGGNTAKGLGNGLWWAAVTMTTVGYGDKAPLTLPGRFVALVWMFASIIVISFFTAGIATSLTVGSLQTGLSEPDDLRGMTVGVVAGSTGVDFARSHRAQLREFTTVQEALDALADESLDAVVYDRPMLLYYSQDYSARDMRVLPGVFDEQSYAFAFPTDSPLREPVNQALLAIVHTSAWEETVAQYLGES